MDCKCKLYLDGLAYQKELSLKYGVFVYKVIGSNTYYDGLVVKSDNDANVGKIYMTSLKKANDGILEQDRILGTFYRTGNVDEKCAGDPIRECGYEVDDAGMKFVSVSLFFFMRY